MSLPLATLIVVIVSIVGNRILAVLAALWLRLPDAFFLSLLISLDLLQIPMFFWLYSHSAKVLPHLPQALQDWFKKDRSESRFSRWVRSLGGPGVMLVSFLPTFGGGMWSAVFLAFSLRLPRRAAVLWIGLGSVLSYLLCYWVLDTLVLVIRYFSN